MTQNSSHFQDVLEQITDFAKSEIYPHREALISSSNYPTEIWQEMGQQGLLGLSLSESAKGAGLSFSEIAKASQALNAFGAVPGLTMSFMTHWMFIKLHLEGNLPPELRADFIPRIQTGEITISVAISEPRMGAHPKHLQTRAELSDGQFVINGEKTFLTNGPIATHYLILAITGVKAGQKQYSAILTPANSDGLTKTEGMKLDFLHPCPHGGIILNNVKVPRGSLLGEEGDGYRQFSLSTRHVEDALGAAAMQGSLQALLTEIAKLLPEEKNADIGAAAARIEGLEPLANKLAMAADTQEENLGDMYLGYRTLSADLLESLHKLIADYEELLPRHTKLLARDIGKIQGIAKSVQVARLAQKGVMFRET